MLSSIVKLGTLLVQLSVSTDELAWLRSASEWRIRDHCDSLRQKVDIARETALENIHEASNTLMVEIDAYEQECLSSWKAAKESNEVTMVDVNKRMRTFIAEQREYLQTVEASDTHS